MKTKILTILAILTFTISCKKEEKKILLPTKNIIVENINFQLPKDFTENGINKWKFLVDRKIAYIEISNSEMKDMNSALDDLKNKEMEKESSKYTLVDSKKGDTLNKKDIIENYKFNNNNQIGGFPVYSYETHSLIEFNNTIL